MQMLGILAVAVTRQLCILSLGIQMDFCPNMSC
jgi:hypothetical protein